MKPNTELPRAVCSTSGLELWARLDRDGKFAGVTNCANAVEAGRKPELGPYPSGARLVPLYGLAPSFDRGRECLEHFYSVETGCVIMTTLVKPLPAEWMD